jgi:hypothetical protein
MNVSYSVVATGDAVPEPGSRGAGRCWNESRGSLHVIGCQRQDPSLQQLEPSPPVRLTLAQFQSVDLPFQRPIAPRRPRRPVSPHKGLGEGFGQMRSQGKPELVAAPIPGLRMRFPLPRGQLVGVWLRDG